ncbi:MAG: MoxR-like ATPase [Methanobacteriota archaeon]|nr:MAG: MoxR-like ATPase [Euryarchaeota archaeon]
MNEVAKVIIGKQENLRRITIGILSNGNTLIEDFPGLAKTLMANTFATALGCKFKRVQFTPDLLPADIMGTYMYDQQAGEFKLRPGPLFTNVLLADEINRAPPKTQAALLEAMEEKQVTIEGITHKLPAPFITMATQNPIEQEGTYPLPEAQRDRFLMKMSMGYPDRREREGHPAAQEAARQGQIRHRADHQPEESRRHAEGTRDGPRRPPHHVLHRRAGPAHPRGPPRHHRSLPACQPVAVQDQSRIRSHRRRDYVIPDDIKNVALEVVSHRILLKPESKIRGVTGRHITRKILSEVPVPVIQ